MRRACSGDYYRLRETVIAEERKRSLISCHHWLFANLHENQHQKTVKSQLLRRPEPRERRDVPALRKPPGRLEPSTCVGVTTRAAATPAAWTRDQTQKQQGIGHDEQS